MCMSFIKDSFPLSTYNKQPKHTKVKTEDIQWFSRGLIRVELWLACLSISCSHLSFVMGTEKTNDVHGQDADQLFLLSF